MTEETEVYASDEQTRWEPDMSPVKRPIWPPIMGGICIALGALGFVCGGIGLLVSPFLSDVAGGFMEEALQGDPPQPSLSPTPITMLIQGVGVLVSGFFLYAAILLVMRRFRARLLMLIYSVLTIPVGLAAYVNQMSIQAADQQWAKDFPDNMVAQGMNSNSGAAEIGQMVGLVLFILLGLGWPAFLLIWFGLVKTKEHQYTGISTEED